ncbi:MAG: MarR family transcriptional regulator [archaeon GW2011_AR16]|nr:MAG: MarR family transcriptional regulator [archaeon GW2011_AR16]
MNQGTKRTLLLVMGLFILGMILPVTQAATIKGMVYDVSLEPLSNTVVEIDTQPKQRVVSQNGTYTFTIPAGTFRIKAYTAKGVTILKAEEKITVKEDEGTYVFDLFLFPTFEDEDELLAGTEFEMNEELINGERTYLTWIISGVIFILFIIVLMVFYMLMKKQAGKIKTESGVKNRQTKEGETQKVKEEKEVKAEKSAEGSEEREYTGDDSLQKIVTFMKQQDGRTTQKELRKQFPFSEAKMSLLIADLEQQKKIKKIKKGRGNILILVQKEQKKE